MLSNAYFLAKFRFDTAENEHDKNLQNLPILLTLTPYVAAGAGAGAGPASIGDQYSEDASVGKFPTGWWTTVGSADPSRTRRLPVFGKISAKCCSFSAVSAPIFATKYAFCSIFKIYQII